MTLALAFFVVAASSSPEPASAPSIAVLDLVPARDADAALAKIATSAFVEAIGKRAKGRVIGMNELKSVVDAQAQARLAGCDDARCLADIGGAITTDQVVVGRIGVIGDRALAFVSLVDSRSATVLARASADLGLRAADVKNAANAMSAQLAPSTFQKGTETLALALLDPSAAKSGDERLGQLRIAVLFDEIDEDGKPSIARPVETCVQKELLDAGADLVSAAVVQKLKGNVQPRDLLRGVIPDAISADDVDVVLAGAVENKPVGEYMSARKVETQLSMTLAKIDTGDIVASENVNAQGLEHSNAIAARKAAEKVCAQVAPKLKAALDKKVARGDRVVLEVSGANVTADSVNAIAQSLEKGVKRIGRARVKRVAKDKAVVDVVVTAGDGLALALELPPTLEVKEASAGTVKAVLK